VLRITRPQLKMGLVTAEVDWRVLGSEMEMELEFGEVSFGQSICRHRACRGHSSPHCRHPRSAVATCQPLLLAAVGFFHVSSPIDISAASPRHHPRSILVLLSITSLLLALPLSSSYSTIHKPSIYCWIMFEYHSMPFPPAPADAWVT
jgi:hypothetical protein